MTSLPFLTNMAEAEAIDARIALWRLKAALGDKRKERTINYHLARLITQGMAYAARLRAMC